GRIDRNAMQMASLDHALWFHHDININDWLVYIKETTRASNGRGFNRGAFYDPDGKLVASSMQECLIRNRG
ncbi:MAG: thioesterase family protein, partial [Pseudomonadales bacterium]|nr:thioesterase family protein [Pseudomonadales bacterium]